MLSIHFNEVPTPLWENSEFALLATLFAVQFVNELFQFLTDICHPSFWLGDRLAT